MIVSSAPTKPSNDSEEQTVHVSGDPQPRPNPSDIARQHPRHLAPMPQEHVPRSHDGPHRFGLNIGEIVPPEQHPDPDAAPGPTEAKPEPATPLLVDEDASATPPNALDTLSGATSKDVARSLGHPGGGVSNAEARRDLEAHQRAAGAADASQPSAAGVAEPTTSKDVAQGLSHPGGGLSNAEAKRDREAHQRAGAAGASQRSAAAGVDEPATPLLVDEDASATPPNALDTLSGATSKDVARGLGHPGGGVSNAEARRDLEAHQRAAGAADASQHSAAGVAEPATSKDIARDLGHPGGGVSNAEARRDREAHQRAGGAGAFQRSAAAGVDEPATPLLVDEDASATPPNALDTLSGATSKDVARGLGHPGGGVSNAEARRDLEAHQRAAGAADAPHRSAAGVAEPATLKDVARDLGHPGGGVSNAEAKRDREAHQQRAGGAGASQRSAAVGVAEPATPLLVDEDASATPPNALDTLSGATSKDVARGLGHPGGGVSNAEARRDLEAHQRAGGTDASQPSVAGVAARS